MKYENPIDIPFSNNEIKSKLSKISEIKAYYNKENLKSVFSFIDLTSLNVTDTTEHIEKMCEKINDFPNQFADMPNVAAICIFPNFLETVSRKLQTENVKIAAVSACFPTSCTFQVIKEAEVDIAIGKGADEIDVVMPLNLFFERNFKNVFKELKSLKRRTDTNHLKVILETGVLPSYDDIWKASLIAMSAGADFIKTSTGKNGVGATPEAVLIMAEAIKYYHTEHKRKVGLKPSGGIVTPADALQYFAIVDNVLGEEWLTPHLFRLGASRLANNLLTEIANFDKNSNEVINYF